MDPCGKGFSGIVSSEAVSAAVRPSPRNRGSFCWRFKSFSAQLGFVILLVHPLAALLD